MRSTRYQSSWHLGEDQLLALETGCPVCGREGPRARAGVIQCDPEVELLLCARCGGVSASRMPTQAVLDQYYSGYFPGDREKITLGHVSGFVDALLRQVHLSTGGRVRLLDFGGGDGSLGLAVAAKLLERKLAESVEFTLVDYQEPRRDAENSRISVQHARDIQSIEGPFDLVLASAVLEHIPRLQPVLGRLFALLAPGGWFYARTPYVTPLKRLAPHLDLTYPGHLHDLGPAFWNQVATTFQRPLRLVVSRPSFVETSFFHAPCRTVAAWLLKLPARIEGAFFGAPRVPWWKLVGGWEVVLQREE